MSGPDDEPTKWVNQLKLGQAETHQDVFEYFHDIARQYAQQRMAEYLKAPVGATQIAASALRSAMERATRSERLFESREQFIALLQKSVRQKLDDASDVHTAQKRDVRRDVVLPGQEAEQDVDQEDFVSSELPADSARSSEIIASREMLSRVIATIMKEPVALKREIGFMHWMGQVTPTEIHESLGLLYADPSTIPDGFPTKRPALSTIQVYCREWKWRIYEQFGIEED